jgi:hypothetical protein
MNSVVLIGRLTANPTSHAGEQHESATFSPHRNRRFRRGPQKRLAVARTGSEAADFIDTS